MATYNFNQNPYNNLYPYNSNYYYTATNNSPTYPSLLNGKLVENADSAKLADVPVGSYGVFPKADLSEVYIKTWNSNGTTNLLTYKLTDGKIETQQNDLTQINEKLSSLEEKLDAFLSSNNRKREVKLNEY